MRRGATRCLFSPRTRLYVPVPALMAGVQGPRCEQGSHSASLASGRAGVKASCSHVRAPCDKATHPTSCWSLPGVVHLVLLVPPATDRTAEEKLGNQVGRRARNSGPLPTPCQAGTQALAPAACPEATPPPRQVSTPPMPCSALHRPSSPPQGPGTPSPPLYCPESRKLTLLCGHLT